MDINHNDIKLVEPTVDLKDEFLAMVDEYLTAGEQNGGWQFENGIEDFAAYVQGFKDYTKGKNLPEGWVTSTNFWLVDGDEVVGQTSLRHELNEDLKKRGGHIGYYIRPSKRGKGYGGMILPMVLNEARKIGLKRVMITCDEDNAASARIIKKNGGKFQDKVEVEDRSKMTCRYWIELD